MKPQFQPWHLLLLILAGWINRRQQDAIEYLLTENRVLREKLGKKRILLNDVPDDGAPEAVLFFVTVVPNALELVEIILDELIQPGGLRISRPVDS